MVTGRGVSDGKSKNFAVSVPMGHGYVQHAGTDWRGEN